MSDQGLLRLGARMAEVEALYVRVLQASGPGEEERGLTELAEAASLLAATARNTARDTARGAARAAAGGRPRVKDHRRRTAARNAAPGRTRRQRRIVRVRRATEWIIARSTGPTG